jgi:hypothetical protein
MAHRKEAITEQRLAKLGRIRSHNIDPYPHRYRLTHTTQEAATLFQEQEGSNAEGLEVRVAGRIVALRAMGKAEMARAKSKFISAGTSWAKKNISISRTSTLAISSGSVARFSGHVAARLLLRPPISLCSPSHFSRCLRNGMGSRMWRSAIAKGI